MISSRLLASNVPFLNNEGLSVCKGIGGTASGLGGGGASGLGSCVIHAYDNRLYEYLHIHISLVIINTYIYIYISTDLINIST